MATADILETAAADDPDLPLAAAMVEVLLANHAQVVGIVNRTRENNPDKDDRRALQGRLIALRNKEDALLAALVALDAPGRDIPTPPDALVNDLARLSGEVEAHANAAVAASAALGLATRFVTVATELLTTLRT